jgi:hypothetical protein
MSKKSTHFEVSFLDLSGIQRTAVAHSEAQAKVIAKGFEGEGMEGVQAHRVTTTREPYVLG